MNSNINVLIERMQAKMNPHEATAMSAYMRDQFSFLGIRSPLRKELLKEFLAQYPPQKKWVSVLWNLPEREYQYSALDILLKIKKQLNPDDLPLIESFITTRSWWDTVDLLAANAAGFLLLQSPDLQEEFGEKWLHSDNMWLNRTAILHQLHYKQDTNEELLYRYILTHAASSEFFIQKAIGWALREYSKINPTSVRNFIENENLKPLSKREGLKWISKNN
ncbi:DNA alkylation repair protein [Paenibacillus sp. 19GGS1-52]|uniref:DNA alkylation repair protein n=1 Tax=Paenibacillus sp. 19GGS1-52 TaxID=2758563 RepID=UPI001EFAC981|nr:DNA alkylation repair protein [Paenibacillus sp. 19GGS1-52]ULO05282.1 DNA alkylation repair protein [Paenibacillus sp. 19GGS1-52]